MAELKVHSVLSSTNFLLRPCPRAMRLLERMKEAGKSWELSIFASANAIRKYTMLELVELGVSWAWMGLESPRSSYSKLQSTDIAQLTRELREHGIRVQGSTIIGLEHHTPTTSWKKSKRRSATRPTFTSSCFTRRFQARRCIRKWPNRAECSTTSSLPMFMDSTNSTSVTTQSPATIQSGFWIGRFGAIFERNGPSLPAGADDAPGLATLQGPPRPARAGAFCAGSEETQQRLQCCAMGNGAGIPESQSQRK